MNLLIIKHPYSIIRLSHRSRRRDRLLLSSMAAEYFKSKKYAIKRNVMLDGSSGLFHMFDMILQKGEEERVVLIMDWKRPVGVNMIIKADKASADVNMPNPIIVARNFSSHAKAYSNRRRITLITRRNILAEIGVLR